MDELIQIALFILFALFSLGSNLLNKRRKQQAETRKSREETEEDTRRPYVEQSDPRRSRSDRPQRRREVSSPEASEEQQPMSFEDILRELAGGSPRQKRQEQKEEIEDDYEHPFSSSKPREEAKKLEQKAVKQSEGFGKSVEQATQARRISDKISIDEQPIVQKLVVKTAKSRKSRKSKQLAHSIAASLRDGQSARKAIILSEIINRKHF